MPTLESISIKGFKSIRDVDVELRDINVLIGANGSGKSNFLEVFSFLQAIHAGNLQSYVGRAGGAERLLHFGSKATEKMEVRVRSQAPAVAYAIHLHASEPDTLRFGSAVAYADSARLKESTADYRLQLPDYGGENDVESSEAEHTGNFFTGLVYSWGLYHFHDTSRSAPVKKTANLHDNRYLRPDGSNLAAFLYLLRERHEFEYGFIQKTVRMVAPFFDEFVLEPLALNPDTIRLEWKHKGTDAYFDASSLSDGTLRFIALATLLQQPKELRPSVILLDEPELGMHPLGITLLAAMVNSASVDTQVILATQSPMLLDYFKPEEVVVADRVDGGTQFTRFTSEELAVWLKRYSIGELWEMNDLGGRPAPERLSHQR